MTLSFSAPVVRPRYGDGSFADLPQLVQSLLLGDGPPPFRVEGMDRLPQRPRQVVFLFLDAFGWSFFQRVREHSPLLRRIEREGCVAQITSQFPSTTSAHVTTLQTGLPVGQHGVFEWNYYEPKLDQVITPLLFSFAGDRLPGTLLKVGARPEAILPTQSLSQALGEHGVASYAYLHHSYGHSPYNAIINRHSRLGSFKTLAEALVNLELQMAKGDGPAFHFFYYDGIDAVCHDHGPDSPQVEAEIEACLDMLERWLQRRRPLGQGEALLLITADHGQIGVDPQTTLYLNQQPWWERVQPLLRTNREGRLLVPGGSARDMFLYVREGALDEAQALLSRELAGRADVVRVVDLAAAGFFGPPPLSEAFWARAGDLVILPHPGETVWWYEKDRFEQKFRGHHGGLTAEEMEIPLLLVPLS
ncbi:MAG: alkaline phosphatase family protein [Caldilineales bacterium]|nr:alkaline phosphatase family protein [Caldilineales bacterium]MDW8316700.1 alkaline phosphatase family protein [Anaerolineae bacterium]